MAVRNFHVQQSWNSYVSIPDKIAAGLQLFSGLALISTLAVIIAPLFHRFLHKFHMDPESGGK
jgi:hypothetical protein